MQQKFNSFNDEACRTFEVCFDEATKRNEVALIVSKIHYTTSKYVADFYCLEDTNVFTFRPLSLFIRRNSTELKSLMNQIIRKTVESGLTEFWRKQFIQKYRSDSSEVAVIPLKIDHVLSVFCAQGIVLCLASLVFLFEMFVFRKYRSALRRGDEKNNFLFWCKVLDSDRHWCFMRQQDEDKAKQKFEMFNEIICRNDV